MSKSYVCPVACLSLVLMCGSSVADFISLTPSQNFASGPQTDQAQIDLFISNFYGVVLPEVYHAVVGSPVVESGLAAGFYTTVFTPTPDPSGAKITWDGGLSVIDASYLLVKGVDVTPGLASWHLFALSDWNGTDAIHLSDFWPSQGSISHVSIYGSVVAVPEPSAIGLVALAVGCLTGRSFRRRRRT
jgi:hypothetical protein